MTIITAPVSASPVTGTRAAATRCQCGGYLALTTGGVVLDHVDTCPNCLDGQPATCALRTLHRTCTTPKPVACLHTTCGNDAPVEPADECVDGLDDCCSCCQPY